MAKIKKRERDSQMNILLVLPGRVLFEYLRTGARTIMPSGSVLEVAGKTSQKHHKVKIHDELARGRVPKMLLEWADVVGISGLTTSRLGAYLVAKRAHELGKTVIAGGMDVTGHYSEGNAEELLAHYDAIVVGRLTSRLWAEVLSDAENDRLEPVYQAGTLDEEEWEWASWRHDLVDPRDYVFPATFRSSAGCPNGCSFCTVRLVCDQVQIKPTDVLARELKLLPKTRQPWIDCCDAFGQKAEHADTALPVLKAAGHGWMTELAIRDAAKKSDGKRSLLERMRDALAIAAYFGVESIKTDALAKLPELSVTEGVIKEAQGRDMLTIASMVLDYTGEETEESVWENVEWLLQNKIDLVQLSLVAALPGSKLREEALLKGLLIEHPEFFCGAWPTIEGKILTPEKRIELLRDAYLQIYSPSGIWRRIRGHAHLLLNGFANLAVNRMSHNWWGRVGFAEWEAHCVKT
jgi:radical SAM superfamily enzyme YgiQ (UPF0313 family)